MSTRSTPSVPPPAQRFTAAHVAAARAAFADRNPQSRAAHERARAVLPGGHTRTTLGHPPFPLTFVRGAASTLTDLDGHDYIDLLGDYTAGILGHSERRVLDAVHAALGTIASAGAIHRHEAGLANLMCQRFGLERVRFTSSRTEANLMAITTATSRMTSAAPTRSTAAARSARAATSSRRTRG